MASPINAVLCALVAAAFWTFVGYSVSRRLLPLALALGTAPVIGWAVVSAATLPILRLIGFSSLTVIGTAALCLITAGASLRERPAQADAVVPRIPPWSFAAAALLAIAPAIAIMPKFSAGGVHLADPIFDHSKIAIIDAMTRQGLPPVNPILGAFGGVGRLAYYYLWHFSAAELALPLHVSGWEADIGLTWFTAFASLTLMMGVAVGLSKRSGAALAVVVLAAGASLRVALSWLFGSYDLDPFLETPTGFAGWIFQSAWAPQHLMSASCVVTASLLMVRYAERQSCATFTTLALVVAAGFESSTYVGGITFAIAVAVGAPIVLAKIEPAQRVRFAIGMAAAAVIAVLLTAPFIRDQFAAVAVRGGDRLIVFHHFEVLGAMFPPMLRRLLDWPAYWLILLPIEFPAYIAGVIALASMLRGATAGSEKTAVAVCLALAGTSLAVSWLLVGTLGDNNDLGMRAVLPAAMILIAGAAAGMMMESSRRGLIVAMAVGGFILSLPDTARIIRSNIKGAPAPDAQVFAQMPELWAAVRHYASPAARVADDPMLLQDVTPWPANMSWALLANRSSCFAGRELALAFAPLPSDRREAINAQFVRVFAGQGTSGDVSDMARKFACDIVVVVPQDGAWNNDPFASSADYHLAEVRDGKWRIYVKASASGVAR
jgi:hypothetical protein